MYCDPGHQPHYRVHVLNIQYRRNTTEPPFSISLRRAAERAKQKKRRTRNAFS